MHRLALRVTAALVAGAVWASVRSPAAVGQEAGGRLRLVTVARQTGPVGYRDPVGAISPDGVWLAYSSGDHLRLVRVAGGPVATLGPPSRRLRTVAWLPDSRRVAARAEDARGRMAWWSFGIDGGERGRLWSGPLEAVTEGGETVGVDPDRASQLAWSADGSRVAGTLPWPGGSALWIANADGSGGRVRPSRARLSFPAWSPDGRTVVCLALEDGAQRLSLPCGAEPGEDDPVAYGPVAVSRDGTIYYGSPNPAGTLDLWARSMTGGPARRLTRFARDSYMPSVSRDGRVLFGTQDYRVTISMVPSGGGTPRQLTAFQSETPSWSRDGSTVAFTFGSWRRTIDDFDYPNIAQNLGTVDLGRADPALEPDRVIRASSAEDQSLDWSPDGRWIVLHSHADGLDDVWLMPADGSAPAHPITRGGHETGWPRWSPDGRWIAYGTEVREGGRWRGVAYLLGIDASTGKVTREAGRVPLEGITGDVDQVVWAGSADSLAFDVAEGLDRRAIYAVAREGGRPRLVHRFRSEQRYSGIGVSPDFRWVAFIAPAPDGHFQVYRVPTSGGVPKQVTTDPSDKTQPAVSPDGRSIALTVVSYSTQFWLLEP
jgi:Tol biopolymer transport system component